MVERYDKLLNEGKDKAALNQNILLTLMYPTIFTVIAFIAILVGTNAIEALVTGIPAWVMTGLKTAGNVLPALGFAILLKTLWRNDIAPFFFIGFVGAAYLGLGPIPIAIIGIGLAVYICLNDYRHIKEMNALKAHGVAGVSETEDFFNE
jgi:PTS system mannose-specific IIC component